MLPDWELALVGGNGSLLEAAEATLAVSVDPGVEEVEAGAEVFATVAGGVAATGEAGLGTLPTGFFKRRLEPEEPGGSPFVVRP